MKEWQHNVLPKQQERFQRPPNCVLAESVQDLNDWKIITAFETEEADEEEAMEICEDILAQDELDASRMMESGGFAAYQEGSSHSVFKIVSQPCALARDGDPAAGCEDLPAGTLVCKGIYLNKVPRAPGWYTHPPGKNRAKRHVFRVRYVIHPNLEMQDPSDEVKLPNRKDRNKILALQPKKMHLSHYKTVQQEIAQRVLLDFEEGTDAAGQDNGEEE